MDLRCALSASDHGAAQGQASRSDHSDCFSPRAKTMLSTAYIALERASSAGPLAPSPALFQAVHRALRHATIPLAIFDEHLRCRASNSAFTLMTGSLHQQCLGKTMKDIFGAAVPELESALLRVWKSGEYLPDRQIATPVMNSHEKKQWLVDLLPVSADTQRVGMVIAAFSEVTAISKIERRLLRLRAGLLLNEKDAFPLTASQRTPFAEGYLDLMQRTACLLHDSVALRRVLSGVRLAHSLRKSALRRMTDDLAHALTILKRPRTLQDASTDCRGSTRAPEALNGFNRPSRRELQVVRFLADGRSNKEIAFALHLSIRTVETYRARLMSKLKVHSAAEIVRYAIRNHFIQA